MDYDNVPIPMIPAHWIDTVPEVSDDKPCTVASLDMSIRVSGLHATVTEEIVIENPNSRDISVPLTLPMPDGAIVCGYALEIDNQMIDGVTVPKEKARVAFETEQRIGADPGLVEMVKGNVYRTRVYPVPAESTRRVRLVYVAPLSVVGGDAAFLDVPMPAERLGKRVIDIEAERLDCPAPELSGLNAVELVEMGTFWKARAEEMDLAPSESLRIALPKLPRSFCVIERDSDGELWFSASEAVPESVAGGSPAQIDSKLSSATILWDASGSRAGADHSAEIQLACAYCTAVGIRSSRVVRFNEHVDEPVEIGDGDLEVVLSDTRYDGGSDFCELSRFLESDVKERDEGHAYILFTDGMDTLSGQPISFPGECIVLAIFSGAARDAEMLRQACRGRAFDVMGAPQDLSELEAALFHPALLTAVDGNGATDILGIGSGRDGRFSILGKMAVDSATLSFENTGTVFELDASSARAGLALSRAWAAKRVAQLSPRASDNAEELHELGRRFGVVSPETSLLVLETIEQWLKYRIEPPKTWESMHSLWEAMSPGLMNVSSEEAMKQEHLAEIKGAWKSVTMWWEHGASPLSDPVPVPSNLHPTRREGFLSSVSGRVMRVGEAVLDGIADTVSGAMPRYEARRGDVCESGMPNPQVQLRMATMEESSYTNYEDAAMPAPGMGAGATTASIMMATMEERVEQRVELDGVVQSGDSSRGVAAKSVAVEAWIPDAPYIAKLREALGKNRDLARDIYYEQRIEHASSPSFFIDCSGWFIANGDTEFGLQVLSNLAEMGVEDAAMLRVMAWRFREVGRLEKSLNTLRRVLKLRHEDSQSHRDVALVLEQLARKSYAAGDEDAARAYAEEAGSFYREVVVTPWQRRPMAIGLFAVEEYNVLRAWAEHAQWKTPPDLPSIDEELEGVLDCDLRVTLAWDADETDVDIHVTEPGGEEAYYAHRFTSSGGRVSEDITDGYGPELYEIRKAHDGAYLIRAHYFASHQQSVFGPASCTLTVYTDWGRPEQEERITTVRLENAKEMLDIGSVAYGKAAVDEQQSEEKKKSEDVRVEKGADISVLIDAYGHSFQGDAEMVDTELRWELAGGRCLVASIVDGKVVRLCEQTEWGEEMVIFQ